MIEQSRFEHLYEKVDGVFKTTVLIQKRLRELNRGARRLVPQEGNTTLETVLHEIEQEKIELIADTEENRELINAQMKRIVETETAQVEVGDSSSEDELERRILSALSKDNG